MKNVLFILVLSVLIALMGCENATQPEVYDYFSGENVDPYQIWPSHENKYGVDFNVNNWHQNNVSVIETSFELKDSNGVVLEKKSALALYQSNTTVISFDSIAANTAMVIPHGKCSLTGVVIFDRKVTKQEKISALVKVKL